jgi:hypothetical protein
MTEPKYEELFLAACKVGEANVEAAVQSAKQVRGLRREVFALRGVVKVAVHELEAGRPSRAIKILKLALEHSQTKQNKEMKR